MYLKYQRAKPSSWQHLEVELWSYERFVKSSPGLCVLEKMSLSGVEPKHSIKHTLPLFVSLVVHGKLGVPPSSHHDFWRKNTCWKDVKLHVKCKSKQDGKWLLWKKTRAVALAQAPRIPLPPLQIAGVLKGHTVSCFFWLRDDCGGVPEVAFNISFTDEDTPPRDVETDIFRQISMPIDDRIISWSHANLLLGTFFFGFLPSIFVAEN